MNQYQLMSGLTTHTDCRNLGIATQILLHLAKYLSQFLSFAFASPELASFYEAKGFQQIVAENLPAELKSRFQRYQQKKELIALQWTSTQHVADRVR